MTRKFFGTDGIRGLTNSEPMTAETALRVGQAAGAHFLRGDHRHRVVIGKDTRLSGYMMESAMVAGFTSVGMDVVLLGPMPTPAVAMLTRSMRADIGVMISASHNPFADNGIKLFGPDGYKLSDATEQAIERKIESGVKLVAADKIGRARRIDDARGRYIHHVKSTFPDRLRLDGLKIVVDCANGAAYHVAPEALWELGADVIPLGVNPDGLNINAGCGSTHPQLLQETRRRERCAHRDRAGWRRGSFDSRRREGADHRRGPDDGPRGAGPEASRSASGRLGRCHSHVQPRP
jgi:phosphoglucosamine mutase